MADTEEEIREDADEEADAVFDKAVPSNPIADLFKFLESLFNPKTFSATEPPKGAAMGATTLQTELEARLPRQLVSYSEAFALATVEHCPADVNALDWALNHAGVIDRECQGGNFLKPRGPGGVGDTTNRWMEKPPPWVGELNLYTEREGWSDSDELGIIVPAYLRKKHVYVYEVQPPAWAGAEVRGWGYGLGQIDFATWREWLASNDWKDPKVNLNKSAEILAAGYSALGSILLADAAYNAGVARIASVKEGQDPDSRTTGGDYSADVIRRASQWGFGGNNIA